MGDAIGPTSTLPGAGHHLPKGAMCDEHPSRPAVARIQGETDSFGAELIDCCAECRDEIRAAIRSDLSGRCDWCRQEASDLRNRRDYEEGSTGPVYQVCGQCRARQDNLLSTYTN